jgi:hypothetical protein
VRECLFQKQPSRYFLNPASTMDDRSSVDCSEESRRDSGNGSPLPLRASLTPSAVSELQKPIFI